MTLLFKVIVSTACNGTHHKLAMDALRHLRGPNADLWRDILLKHYESYLAGSKAPDDQFKDFKNHVLHVSDNYWGGATAAARLWYERTSLAIRKQYWADVAFSAGVLSHYYSDPHMPFHTGQTEEEGKVHRAAEWSVSKSYDELQNLLEQHLGGYPEVIVPSGSNWLEQMVREAAELAHPHYHTIIDHYDLAKGTKNPLAGLDQQSKDLLAPLLGHAAVGFARILDKLAAETRVVPPPVELTLESFLASTKIPVRWITKKIADEKEREIVERIYEEVRKTGKVVANLPEDDRTVRRLYAEQVLKVPVAYLDAQPARPAGMLHGTGAKPKPLTSVEPILEPAERRRKPVQPKVLQPAATLAKPASFKPRMTPLTGPRRKLKTTVAKKRLVPANHSENGEQPFDSENTIRRPTKTVAVPVSFAEDNPTPAEEPKPEKFPKKNLSNLPVEKSPVEELDPSDIVADQNDETTSPNDSDTNSPAEESPRRSRIARLKNARPIQWIKQKIKIPDRLRQGFSWKGRKQAAAEPDVQDPETEGDEPRVVNSHSRRESLAIPDERPTDTRDDLDERPVAVRHRDDLQPLAKTSPASSLLRGERAERNDHRERNSREDRDEPESSSDDTLRFHLDRDQPLEAAPSIGPKMAKKFEALGIHTVRDFLEQEASQISAQLNLRHIDSKMIRDWQAQTKLACRVPKLRGHDAQVLVAVGVTEPEELASMSPQDLWELVEPFLGTNEAQRILRSSAPPDLDEIKDWIEFAKKSRPLKAA